MAALMPENAMALRAMHLHERPPNGLLSRGLDNPGHVETGELRVITLEAQPAFRSYQQRHPASR